MSFINKFFMIQSSFFESINDNETYTIKPLTATNFMQKYISNKGNEIIFLNFKNIFFVPYSTLYKVKKSEIIINCDFIEIYKGD